MFTDELGLIVQENGDGGDTAANEGRYWYNYQLVFRPEHSNAEIVRVLNILQIEKGVFVRHPTQYKDPKDFSRDQTVPLILTMGEWQATNTLWLLFKKQVNNFFRFQNGDIGLFEDLNYYIRAFRWSLLYPVLLLGDLQMLINTLIICVIKARSPNFIQQWLGKHVHYIFVQGEPNNKDGVPQDVYGPTNCGTDINHTLVLIQAQNKYPTPISWLARKLYKWLRPKGVQFAWSTYFAPTTGANPFDELYKKVIINL